MERRTATAQRPRWTPLRSRSPSPDAACAFVRALDAGPARPGLKRSGDRSYPASLGVAETDLEVGLGAWPPLLSEAELKIRAQSPFSVRRGRLGRAQTVRGSEHGRISAAL